MRRCGRDLDCGGGELCVRGACALADSKCQHKPEPGPFVPRIGWAWSSEIV